MQWSASAKAIVWKSLTLKHAANYSEHRSGDCNEVNKIMARGEILKKKTKKQKGILLFRLSDGMVKNILNVYYNIMFFHQKVKKFLVLKPYINIYNTSEQQIFINL